MSIAKTSTPTTIIRKGDVELIFTIGSQGQQIVRLKTGNWRNNKKGSKGKTTVKQNGSVRTVILGDTGGGGSITMPSSIGFQLLNQFITELDQAFSMLPP